MRACDGATLALDAGQTATKIRLTRPGGDDVDLVGRGVDTQAPLLPQLAAIAAAVRDETDAAFSTVALGVSGLTGADADAESLLTMLHGLGTRRVLLAHDSITSFLGALGDRPGAVVAAGTGAVTLGVGPSSVVRIDGWGNIMGDAGSAYWIGREALDVAMRAHDGREAPTALVDVVRARWPEIEAAYVHLQSDPDRVRIVASFAQAVTDLAPTDAAAARISLRAARELARSATVALERVADGAEPQFVCAIGGVFHSPLIRGRFDELMSDARPAVSIVAPQGAGVDGVALLPLLPVAHPLHAHMSVASVASADELNGTGSTRSPLFERHP